MEAGCFSKRKNIEKPGSKAEGHRSGYSCQEAQELCLLS